MQNGLELTDADPMATDPHSHLRLPVNGTTETRLNLVEDL